MPSPAPSIYQAVKLAESLEQRAIYRLPYGYSPVDPAGCKRLEALFKDLERRAKFICWFTKYYHTDKISFALNEFIAVWQLLQKEHDKWSSSK